ncbi:MAG: pyrroline-5-carboxylate reductase [Litoreibacter sp.]
MNLDDVNDRGLVLLGCGKMGSAMLQGWMTLGVEPAAVHVRDPHPSDWLNASGVQINGDLPENPAVVLLAVKPQMMEGAISQLQHISGSETVFLSVAAGTSIGYFEQTLGENSAIVRAMPNTPAAIGKGITAIVGNAHATAEDLDLVEALLSAVGQVVRLSSEDQIDAVTGVSGSGPAYVFYLIETLADAGVAQGLPPELAMQLAKATVAGAGALAESAAESPSQLRINVTSPGGTTAEALEVLMEPKTGFSNLLNRAVKAAADRGRELSK